MDPSFPDQDHVILGQGTFHTTHWSVVLAAREQDDGTQARAALTSLCSTYWYPLYAFVRRQGVGPHEAEDLTQEFFYRFLQRNSLRNVSPAGGRFRSFLLACLKHFLANQRERAHAQRRGGGQAPIPLPGDSAETRYSLELADNVTPEVLFERRWAFAVLGQALRRLEEEYARRGQGDLFVALQGSLPGGQGEASRSELASSRGMSAGAVDVAVHRLRQRFGALLREEVAQTVASPDEVEEEIRYLISVLGS
jgi:DNA-directed RNA polymerase specialized sigma24 family protein